MTIFMKLSPYCANLNKHLPHCKLASQFAKPSSPHSAATSHAPRGLAGNTVVGAKPARSSDKPAGGFRLRTGFLRWLLENPGSDPGSASRLRARWLSILSMPLAPGSSCVGN